MDLNLNLGFPDLPTISLMDLDLSLAPISSPPLAEEVGDRPVDVQEPAASRPPYSPAHASPYTFPVAMGAGGDPFSFSGNNSPYRHLNFVSSTAYQFYYNCHPFHPSFDSPPPLSPSTPYSPPHLAAMQEDGGNPIGNNGIDLLNGAPSCPPSSFTDQSTAGGERHGSVPVTTMTFPGFNVEEVLATHRSISPQASSAVTPDERSSSVGDLLQTPELRFRSLIDSNRRARARQFRASLPSLYETSSSATSSIASAMGQTCDVRFDRSVEASGKNKVKEETTAIGGLEKESCEKNRSVVNFECNICLDVAKEPVVTSCGHLFCWPCLYQWLHVHSAHKECPVCKGEVNEASLTPIYGRGSSEDTEQGPDDGRDTNLKVPPRPRGRRFESARQQMQRPLFRRVVEEIRNSLRRNFGGDWRNSSRLEDAVHRPFIHLSGDMTLNARLEALIRRLRASQLARLVDDLDGGSDIASSEPPIDVTMSQLANIENALDNLTRVSSAQSDRTGSISTSGGNHSASASPVNPENYQPQNMGDLLLNEQFTIQSAVALQSAGEASTSSTFSLAQEDAGVFDMSVELAEPSSAGSSRVFRRRRRWNEISSSLDELLPNRKRRRLN